MQIPNFAALAADLRDRAEADRKARAERAADIKRLADGTSATWQAERAARAIRECGPIAEADVIVILQALAEAVSRDNMHLETRQDFVDELYLEIECQQELIEADAAWHGEKAA